jgi:hypothetical protein
VLVVFQAHLSRTLPLSSDNCVGYVVFVVVVFVDCIFVCDNFYNTFISGLATPPDASPKYTVYVPGGATGLPLSS